MNNNADPALVMYKYLIYGANKVMKIFVKTGQKIIVHRRLKVIGIKGIWTPRKGDGWYLDTEKMNKTDAVRAYILFVDQYAAPQP